MLNVSVRRCLRAAIYLEVFPELHNVCHVNLIEGGEHGIGVLGPLEAFSHACPQPGDLDTPLRPVCLAPRLF